MKQNVLIVDDSKKFVEGLTMMLQTFFPTKVREVFVAHDGKTCLEILKQNTIDLIFMDYEMPGINGAEVTRIAMEFNRYLRIIGLSYHAEFEYIQNMLEAGAKSYIVKDQVSREILEKYI